MTMPIGLMQTALYPDDLERSFQLVSPAGAEGIEIAITTPAMAAQLLSPLGIQMIEGFKRANAVMVPSISLGVLMSDATALQASAAVWQEGGLVRQAIDAARRIGADVVLLPFFGKAAIETEAELDQVIAALGHVAEPAERAGVVLGIEVGLNINKQLFLMDNMATYPAVKMYYDTGNMLARKWDPATGLRDLGKHRLCQIHVKDVRLVEGAPPNSRIPLGAGDVNFQAVANAVAAIGFDGWMILETPPGDDPLASAKANVKFARELFLKKS
jgi:sugar phosphate isomerase/epimerase